MEVLLLGTAAAEGWPCPFCACSACTRARELGGKDIRSRPGALIDDCVKVDYSPDTVMQMQRCGRDFRNLTTLVFTHAHNDHFSPNELMYRGPSHVTMGGLPLLHVYGSAGVMARLETALADPARDLVVLEPPLEPFVERITDDGTTILPLLAQHSADPLLLKITRGGKSIFYGHDTGPLPQETVEALSGARLDIALLDCTYGGVEVTGPGHMGIDDVLTTVERLSSVGAVWAGTQTVATHFSHNGLLLHAELEARFAGTGVAVAYDGLVLTARGTF